MSGGTGLGKMPMMKGAHVKSLLVSDALGGYRERGTIKHCALKIPGSSRKMQCAWLYGGSVNGYLTY